MGHGSIDQRDWIVTALARSVRRKPLIGRFVCDEKP